MNKTRLVAILATTLCAGLLPMASSAESVSEREHREQARIHQGIQSGEITRGEARRLEAEQAKIRADKRLARQNGVTPKERRQLQRELNKASRDIRRQKHDQQNQS